MIHILCMCILSCGRENQSMMTGEQYEESIRKLNMALYMFGQKLGSSPDESMLRPSLNSVKVTYELAQLPEYEELLSVQSHLTGEKISRFCHIHQNVEDLVKKVKMLRLLGQKTASCFQRCVGMDALNSVYSTTYEIDQKYGTCYHSRFLAFLRYVQDSDLTVDGAMTDVKGNRCQKPGVQSDPDLYLHVAKRLPEGLVVRGAKAHQTGACNSHEILVMPTESLREGDEDFAVCFAIPTDTPGLTMVAGRQSCDTRRLEGCPLDTGNTEYGGVEALVIFEDVFVPYERVFMDGELDFTGTLVGRFAGFHRQSYGGCKAGVGDVLIGAAALVAESSGVENTSHVKDKLVEMIHLNETLYACGIACSSEGRPTACGAYTIDILLANVCKQNVTRFPYEITRLAEDIAGGLMVTAPSEKDFQNEGLAPLLEKYLAGARRMPTQDRIKLLRLMENLTLGSAAVAYRTESMHGAGSPQAQRIMIARWGDIEGKKTLARRIAKIAAPTSKNKWEDRRF